MDAEKTTLRAISELGQSTYIGANSGSPGWKQFINSEAIAADFVEPEDHPPLTTAEKLAAAGFDVEELRSLLLN